MAHSNELESGLNSAMDTKERTYKLNLTQTESHAVGETVTASSGTHRKIKSRQAQMIAIGGSIGTGLFVGAGQALAIGGPGYLLAAYCLTSMLVYGVVTATMEIGTYLPVEGASMAYYCSRYVSKSMGFALGWLYFYSFGILVAYEITAAAILIDYWPNAVPTAVWVTIMIIVIVALNFSPIAVYAETEFWFAGIKIVMLLGLLILSFVLMLGGGPNHERLGFRYWNNPGATKPYLLSEARGEFTSFLYVWVLAGFSFYFGPELIIFTSGEMANPRKNLPIASRQFFYRLVFFYVLGAIAIGAICNSEASGLTSGTGDANASPWVIAVRNAGISALPSIINAGILTSAWSAGNAYLYMSSRSLFSLAKANCAPRIFLRCTKWGLPIYAVAASSCFALLAYMNVSSSSGRVFNWFISLTNSAGYTSWIVCCLTYLRFRKACNIQKVSVPYRSVIQPYAAWVCLPIFLVLLLCNGFTVFYPGQFDVATFLTTYLGIPIFLILWLGHKVVAGRSDMWFYRAADVDLQSGMTQVLEDEAKYTAEAEAKQARPFHSGRRW